MHEWTVQLYGELADASGPQATVHARATVPDVRAAVAAARPAIADALTAPTTRACVDGAFVPHDAPLAPGSVVEFLPVVSGG